MQRLFQGNAEERARKRNLCISIVKHIAENQEMLESAYKTQEIAENFCFRQRDIKYYLTDFFCPAENSQYCFQPETRKIIEKFLEAHKRALPALDEARVCFKTGRMPDWGIFFRQTRRLDAGILTDFKSNQRSPGGKRCLKTAF